MRLPMKLPRSARADVTAKEAYDEAYKEAYDEAYKAAYEDALAKAATN